MNDIDYIKIKYSSSLDSVKVDVDLSSSDEGTYFMDYGVQNMYEEIKGHAEISKKDSQRINDIINNNKIPIITKGLFGLDGHTVEISLKYLGNEVIYCWWVSPNSEWKPLEDLIKIVSKYLPFDLYD
ncbi:hypothetical protein GM661_07885 [Iocasia frigidifontis]|uniref:Uncharacterized protein n=1 Tax=Iocasia fonsfrigidae TaxID=2682810 RepID=A0A8A7KG92_9FIRM|nr:hypothetical protein [Iocasia fonsfrigidae]QTL97907.1 hypothetical protein GM661_07885 [Iocasia fonsfrigidae]